MCALPSAISPCYLPDERGLTLPSKQAATMQWRWRQRARRPTGWAWASQTDHSRRLEGPGCVVGLGRPPGPRGAMLKSAVQWASSWLRGTSPGEQGRDLRGCRVGARPIASASRALFSVWSSPQASRPQTPGRRPWESARRPKKMPRLRSRQPWRAAAAATARRAAAPSVLPLDPPPVLRHLHSRQQTSLQHQMAARRLLQRPAPSARQRDGRRLSPPPPPHQKSPRQPCPVRLCGRAGRLPPQLPGLRHRVAPPQP